MICMVQDIHALFVETLLRRSRPSFFRYPVKPCVLLNALIEAALKEATLKRQRSLKHSGHLPILSDDVWKSPSCATGLSFNPMF